MLLTLATGSLASMIGDAEDQMSLLEVPDFAVRHLQLRGLNVPASMLAGWSLEDLDALRDRADKAACPCLVLFEDSPLPFGHRSEKKRDEAADRTRRLAVGANRLGCNALALRIEAADNDEAFERAADEIKRIMPAVERQELNILLSANTGLTASPERLTDLIKKIGGFRIGSLPSFADAAATGDVIDALRKLAPYAGAIHATVDSFTGKRAHKGYDLSACVSAIRSVGFLNTLAIDYVGTGDPVEHIESARLILQNAIDAED
ncbi:MAG: TIM barrel protein [Planctomycetota bacterium]